MLDCRLFGSGPAGFHLVNLFLHIANTLLLFTVLKKMTDSLWPSAFVAAAFALHPMHVESVAWIAERKDVLSTFFWLLTMWAYVRFVGRPKPANYLLAIVFFTLGLMAKPMLVTLPFVLLLLDYWPLERFGGRSVFYLIREKIPFFILAFVSGIVTFLVQRTGGAVAGGYLSFSDRFANVFLSYTQYINKMFWPRNLAVFYPFHIAGVPFWQIAACALLLLGISVFVVLPGRNQKYLSVGWFWFVGTLVPVIGFVQVGRQAYADRYTYIPYIGLFIMLAWGLRQLLSKWPRLKIVLSLSMIIVLTTLGICAHRQTSYWKNSLTLFSHAIDVTQNNYLAYYNLGAALDNLDRRLEAIDAYKQTVKIRPDYAEAYYNLGLDYGSLGRLSEEIAAYEQVIKNKPDDAEAYNNLGVAYGKFGRLPEAINAFKQVIRTKPDDIEAYHNLAIAYSSLGRWSEAIDAYKQAVRIRPDYTEAHRALGLIYLLSGDKDSALIEYNILKSLNPQYADELLNRINK